MSFFKNFKKWPLGRQVLLFLTVFIPVMLSVEYLVIDYFDNKVPEVSVYDPDPVIPADNEGTTPEPPPKNDGEREAEEYRRQAVERQISQSPYNETIKDDGKPDCEIVFRDYEQEILKSIEQKKLTNKLKETTNDVLLQSCIRDTRFQKRYDELQDMLADALE